MQDIITALKAIKPQSSFCAKQTIPLTDLNIAVKEFGQLSFPLKPKDIKALIKLAQPAKFGLREQTLLDKNVRDAWEITNNQININETVWNKALATTLMQFKEALGLPIHAHFTAKLHNLLIYEPGQFFDYHQDSEKETHMVATMVIVLPSKHQGGALVISHQGTKKQFDSARFAQDKLTAIAFYADCHHTVKKVKTGYRVALTYNVMLKNDATQKKTMHDATSYPKLTKSLETYFSENKRVIEALNETQSVPNHWVYLLDYHYTEQGLSWDCLKNADNHRAEALKVVAERLGLDIHLVLAEVQDTCECDINDNEYYYDDEDTEEYDDDEDYDNEEDDDELALIERHVTLSHWRDSHNKSLNYKEYTVLSEYIGWTKANNRFKPFHTEYEPYTGNEGSTLDRWYHRAAVVLWRKMDSFAMLLNIDLAMTINQLLKLAKHPSQQAHFQESVTSLLPYWAEHLQQCADKSIITNVFKLALEVNEPQLAKTLLSPFDMRALSAKLDVFLMLQEEYSVSWSLELIKIWATPKEDWRDYLTCENLLEIITRLSKHHDNQTPLIDWLLNHELQMIKEDDEQSQHIDDYAYAIAKTAERLNAVTVLLQACMVVNNRTIGCQLVKHIVANSTAYPSTELVDMIKQLQHTLPKEALTEWCYEPFFEHVFNKLSQEKAHGLRRDDDWSIKTKLSCQCDDCEELSEFLQSKTLKVARWPLRKNRRAHIHHIIERSGIPITHETEHRGSPHHLILTKTAALHQQAKQQFKKVTKALARLEKLIAHNRAQTK